MTTPPLTPEYMSELRALCDAATPGPWPTVSFIECAIGQHNRDFIQASRTALPALLDEVERLQGIIRDAHDTDEATEPDCECDICKEGR